MNSLKEPLNGVAIVAIFVFIVTIICLYQGIDRWVKQDNKVVSTINKPTCPSVRIDTLYNMITKTEETIKWDFPKQDLITDKKGCPISQEILLFEIWSPIIEHSDISKSL